VTHAASPPALQGQELNGYLMRMMFDFFVNA
jgi:hypothetical protein